MAGSVHYGSYSEARVHLKELLDAAARGRPASVQREGSRAAVVDAGRLRHFLSAVGPRAEVVAEAGGWTVLLPGTPVAADGATLAEALDETVRALREYADDWVERLADAPNHGQHWGLVQLVSLSDDDDLRAWLVGDRELPASA